MRRIWTDFWNCWRSKLGNKNAASCNVSGLANEASIAAKFAEHFANASKGNNAARCGHLLEEYINLRNTYIGQTYLTDYSF